MCISIPPDLFGIPREGVHSWRIFDFAAVDVIGTIAIAFILTIQAQHLFLPVLVAIFIIAEILHYAAGVDTQFMSIIGANPSTLKVF